MREAGSPRDEIAGEEIALTISEVPLSDDVLSRYKFGDIAIGAVRFFCVANVLMPLTVWYFASTVDHVPLFAVAIFISYSVFALWAFAKSLVNWSAIRKEVL